jgi:ABC-type Mn2+/Zn2+ transport system ATPase subunit
MIREWVVRAEELAIGYRRHALFRDLSFDIARGEILGIVGPNGCGKTTLLRTVLGLLEPLAGRVERQSGLRISYVPQRERIERIIPVTAFEVVLMGPGATTHALQRLRRAEREAAIIDFLRDLNRQRRVTILIVTHLLPLVLNLASTIMLMSAGAILQGSVDEVLQEDRLRALYGVPVRLALVAGQRTLVVERGKSSGV